MFRGLPRRAHPVLTLAVAIGLFAGAGRAQAGYCLIPPPCPVVCAAGWVIGGAVVISTLTPKGDSSSVLPDPPPPKPTPPICPIEGVTVSIALKPSASDVPTGETFTVAIQADITHEIVAYGFHLDFDDTLLALESLDVNPSYRSLRSSHAAGVAALAYPNTAVGDDVLLATARFTARRPGDATIALSVTPGDDTEGFAQRECGFASLNTAPITIKITHEIPEPATMGMLLGGLCLIRCRLRRW